jgi:hypothetical protein
MYTITGYRETAGNRGLAPFVFNADVDSPEEALEKCGLAFGTYDVASGTAVFTAAQFADVQVTSDDPEQVQPCLEIPPFDEIAGPVHSSDTAIVAEFEAQSSAATTERASDSNG